MFAMPSLRHRFAMPAFAALLSLVLAGGGAAPAASSATKRVPAEWEPQEAVWLQWPGRWEKAYEEAFAKMSTVIAGYQTLHILVDDDTVRDDARAAIADAGGDPDHVNIVWHEIANDSAWMRDNGPVYVVEDGEIRIQNWEFDAWGGAFGADIPYGKDNRVPAEVGAYLNMPVDQIDIVHERGNLEFNGVDTVILNWSTLGDPRRNPNYSKEEAEADLKEHFGVSKVGVHRRRCRRRSDQRPYRRHRPVHQSDHRGSWPSARRTPSVSRARGVTPRSTTTRPPRSRRRVSMSSACPSRARRAPAATPSTPTT